MERVPAHGSLSSVRGKRRPVEWHRLAGPAPLSPHRPCARNSTVRLSFVASIENFRRESATILRREVVYTSQSLGPTQVVPEVTMTRSLRGTRVVLCATVLTVAGCNSNPVGPDAHFGTVAGSNAEQRVGSTGGGGAVCVDETDFCSIRVTVALTTAGGDQISGECIMESTAPVVALEENEDCGLWSGTGRFAGMYVSLWTIRFASSDVLTMFLQFSLPSLGGQAFQVENDLQAVTTVQSNTTCGQFTTTRFSGTLEHFGRVTGEISYCSPSA